jgi:hypothetical protein
MLLTLDLVASTLVACESFPVREDDTLAGYRQELARLVEAGALTKHDAEKFYGIASLEIERRAAQRSQQRQGNPAAEFEGAVNRPSFGHVL